MHNSDTVCLGKAVGCHSFFYATYYRLFCYVIQMTVPTHFKKPKKHPFMNYTYQPVAATSISTVINHLCYYSVQSVKTMFNVTDRTLRYWRKENKLTCIKKNNRVFFEKVSTDAALVKWEQLRFL